MIQASSLRAESQRRQSRYRYCEHVDIEAPVLGAVSTNDAPWITLIADLRTRPFLAERTHR
jgi:hypothetical protein